LRETSHNIAGPASRAATLKALADADRVVRVGAVRARGRLGEAKRLIGLLASKDAWVRRVAAYTLGRAQIAAGVGPLANTLGDPDELVVQLAIDALGRIGPPAAAAVPALERLLETTGDRNLSYDVKKALEKIRK
jgi:HEAT repeat protein